MGFLQFHSICCKNPISSLHFSSINKDMWRKKHGGYRHILTTIKLDRCCSSSSCGVVHAVEKEYEIDPDKANEALQKLDQQLQQLSQKQVSAPKTKALDVKITRDDQTIDDEEDELGDISGTSFALATATFFLFTIFYNIFYLTVIDKPNVM